MRRARLRTLALPPLLLLGACYGPRTEVTVTANPYADVGALRSFAFAPADRLDLSGSQMADPVTRRNLEAAIGRGLKAAGYEPSAEGSAPALLVSYFADVYEGPMAGSQMTTNWERQGKLLVDLVDVATGQVAWRGEAWALNPGPRIAEKVVVELMAKLPRAR
jgi:hypothetical protein